MAQKNVVVLTGISETIKALDEFDKDALKRFNDVVTSELNMAKTKAKGFIPASAMSGWTAKDVINPRKSIRGGAGFPPFDQGKVVSGIRSTRKQGKAREGDYTTTAGALIQQDAAGAIFEIAGRRGANNQFVKNLDRFGKASRAIWRAVDEERQGIERRVEAALNAAKSTLQRHFNERRG